MAINLPAAVLARIPDPEVRRVLEAFDLDENAVVDPGEAPWDVLELQHNPDRVHRDARGTEPIVERLARGEVPARPQNIDRALAARIDHTQLSPTAKPAAIEKLCIEAVRYGFRAVCVMPGHVAYAKKLLEGSGVKVACVVGFPAGTSSAAVKAHEAREVVRAGADEIDVVANPGIVVEGRDRPLAYREYHDELAEVARAAGVPVKVIIQTNLLRKAAEASFAEADEARVEGDRLVQAAAVLAATALVRAGCTGGFVKTCDGVYCTKATSDDVAIMAAAVRDFAGIKASAGVRDLTDAEVLLAAGADIFGTSGGIKLVEGARIPAGEY